MKTNRLFLGFLILFSLFTIACDDDGSSKTSVSQTVEGAPLSLFSAIGSNGRQLWTTDGTLANTTEVLVINSGGDGLDPSYYDDYRDEFGYLNGRAYFRADNGTDGFELWVSDGSAAGTHMVRDIYVGNDSDPHDFIAFGGKLYFAATTATGTELWKTDGTETGTTRAVTSGQTLTDPGWMVVFNSRLYFAATNSGSTGLWSIDKTGSADELTITGAGAAGGLPQCLTVYRDMMIFTARTTADGRAVWKTDGTDIGTEMVADISAGTGDLLMENFTIYNSEVYFSADGGTTGQELWVTDGTEEGTMIAADIYTGSNDSSPESLITLNGRLYFLADTADGTGLWVYDSITGIAGKMPLVGASDLAVNPRYLTLFNDQIYFQAEDSDAGIELWVTDGTSYGTHLVSDINGSGDSDPMYLTVMEDRLYFSAGSATPVLWTTDGTDAGTDQVSSFSTYPLGFYL